ncbi:MAG: tol-pal system protein YbgF [Deltaproteobacteria bacterium]|nr:tol-pal system protein YbgF [Deltaproteobacteria bacterium]MBI2230176.1 tol-pal system protein YbgF [Deltaproteobacteria bacterium]MBI2367688.1 tol-pal system protein YbgF [Deltaproteobacteria bacterium]
MKIVGRYLAIPWLVWLSACVQPQQVDLIEREQRRLRSESTTVQSDVGTLRSDIDAMRSSLADTRANVQQLQREFSALKERVEETRFQMGRQLGQSSREGDQRIKDLEGRVAKLGDALKTQEATLKARDDELKQLRDTIQTTQKALAELPPSEAAPEVVVGESEAVRRDYEAARRALEKKDYKLAVGRFKEFLKKHAKSKLAVNAQYWLGECHYALREFDQAIIEFDAVRRKYPQGDKVPAALLKQGYAFAELGEKVNARLILQEVVEKYPQSSEAAKAKLKLKALES